METSVVRSAAAEHLSVCLSLLDFKLIMYLSVLLGQAWLKNREIPVIRLMDEVFVSCSSFAKGCAHTCALDTEAPGGFLRCANRAGATQYSR